MGTGIQVVLVFWNICESQHTFIKNYGAKKNGLI